MIRLAIAVFLAFSATSVCAAEIVFLVGKPIQGTIIGLDQQNLTVKDKDGKEIKISVKDLASVDLGTRPLNLTNQQYDEIELVDGSLLRTVPGTYRLKADKGEYASLGKDDLPAVTIPLKAMNHLMRDAHVAGNRIDWKKLTSNRGKRDLVVIREKSPTGDILNQAEGTVLKGNDTGDRIEFEQASGEKSNYPLVRFTGGIVFNQPPRDVIPPMICRVNDAFGNNMLVTSFEINGSKAKVTTISGAVLEYSNIASLGSLDFRQGNIRYLAEFDPVVDAPKPVEGEPYFTFTRDKTALGTPLRLEGKLYTKGLWIYPETSLTYNLNGEYKTFKALVGIDETVQIANSTVKLTIDADGRKLLDQKIITRKDKPLDLVLDVKDVKTLKITVVRDALYAGNSINLVEARVQK